MRTLLLSITLLQSGLCSAGSFGSSAKGTSTAGFLKLGAGARAASMGGAYSAVSGDANSVYWNPAALTGIKGQAAAFTHASHIDSSFFEYAAYAKNLGDGGAIGAGLQYLSAGRITETDNTGTDTGSFTPNDLAVSLAYAWKFKDLKSLSALNGFSLGLAAKLIRSTIIDTAQAMAVDFGALSPAYMDNKLNFAFTVSNLGGKMKFEQERENLPLALKVGSAYKITERWLTVGDISFPRDNEPQAALGTEYLWRMKDDWSLAGRAGYNSRTTGDINGVTGFSLGMGFANGKLGIDYAMLPFGSFGLTHRVSLSFSF